MEESSLKDMFFVRNARLAPLSRDITVMGFANLHQKYRRRFGDCHPRFKQSLMIKNLESLDFDPSFKFPPVRYSTLAIDRSEGRVMVMGTKYGKMIILDLTRVQQDPKNCFKAVECGRTSPATFGHVGMIDQIAFYGTEDSVFASTAADRTVKIWDTEGPEVVETFYFGQHNYVHSISWNTTGENRLAVALGCPEVKIADLTSGDTIMRVQWPSHNAMSVDWHPHKPFQIAISDKKNSHAIFDIRNCRIPLLQYNDTHAKRTLHSGNHCKFSPNGQYLISDSSHELCCFDIDSEIPFYDRQYFGHKNGGVRCTPTIFQEESRCFVLLPDKNQFKLRQIGPVITKEVCEANYIEVDVKTQLPGSVASMDHRLKYQQIFCICESGFCCAYSPFHTISVVGEPEEQADQDNWSSDDDF